MCVHIRVYDTCTCIIHAFFALYSLLLLSISEKCSYIRDCSCMYTCTCTSIRHVCTCICVYTSYVHGIIICTNMYVYVCVRAHVYGTCLWYMYVYMYVYTSIRHVCTCNYITCVQHVHVCVYGMCCSCMVHVQTCTCTRVVYTRVCASYMTRYFFTNSSYIYVGEEGAA